MNYRKTDIWTKGALDSAGTKIIDINVKDIISRISLVWRPTKSKHGMDSYCHKDITKIALVDGSDVLHSMDGGENQALAIYDRRCPSMNFGEHLNGVVDVSTYGIDFGRHLYDPMLALDPSRFRNLQLKVTYDEDVADTGVTDSTLEVIADVFDEKVVSPMGFLMSKEIWNATPPASGYTYVDLPTDHPIRKMLIQGYRAAYEPWYQVSEARLSEDNEKRIPFDWILEDYYMMMKGIWAMVVEQFQGLAGGATTYRYFTTPTDYWATPSIIGDVAGSTYLSITGVPKGGVFYVQAETGTPNTSGIVAGYCPNHCFEFPFGDPKDLDDWYDVTKLGSLRLRLKAGTGAANGTNAVILQQLRRY